MDQYVIATDEYLDQKRDEGLILWMCRIFKVVEIVNSAEDNQLINVVCENLKHVYGVKEKDLFLSGDSRIHGCEYSAREIYDRVGRYFVALHNPEIVYAPSCFVFALHRQSINDETGKRLGYGFYVRDIFVTNLIDEELFETYSKASQANCLADFAVLEDAIDNTENKIARLRNRNISEEEGTKILDQLIGQGRAKNGLKKENIADNMGRQHD